MRDFERKKQISALYTTVPVLPIQLFMQCQPLLFTFVIHNYSETYLTMNVPRLIVLCVLLHTPCPLSQLAHCPRDEDAQRFDTLKIIFSFLQ